MKGDKTGILAIRYLMNRELEIMAKQKFLTKLGFLLMHKGEISEVACKSVNKLELLVSSLDRALLQGQEHKAVILMSLLHRKIKIIKKYVHQFDEKVDLSIRNKI